ncbi:hypothetical protein FACS189434_09140 [Bacteroidia bacterium]|nr:hypothetical protein FACS189434_09140 [Bacteroidia bacterium]
MQQVKNKNNPAKDLVLVSPISFVGFVFLKYTIMQELVKVTFWKSDFKGENLDWLIENLKAYRRIRIYYE